MLRRFLAATTFGRSFISLKKLIQDDSYFMGLVALI